MAALPLHTSSCCLPRGLRSAGPVLVEANLQTNFCVAAARAVHRAACALVTELQAQASQQISGPNTSTTGGRGAGGGEGSSSTDNGEIAGQQEQHQREMGQQWRRQWCTDLQAALARAPEPTTDLIAMAFAASLPRWERLAAVLLRQWEQPEQQAADRLALAQAAATRSCANLRCANLGLEGGPGAGEGKGCKRCGSCRAVYYCSMACSHADWPGGHRRVCKALGAARLKERQHAAAALADLA